MDAALNTEGGQSLAIRLIAPAVQHLQASLNVTGFQQAIRPTQDTAIQSVTLSISSV